MVVNNYYNNNAEEYFNKTINVNLDFLYKPFLELLRAGSKILDAGCGSGRDSIYFIKCGYDVTSFDSSIEMTKLASKAIGKDVLKMSFQDVDYVDEYNGIWTCSSLLHVPKRDINDVLKLFTRALKINGILFASFKYGEGQENREQGLFNNYNDISIR